MATSSQQEPTQVFRAFYAALAQSIQDPDWLTLQLYASNIISRNVREEIIMGSLTREQKNAKLLATVESQLATDPHAFDVFLRLLRERPELAALCTRIEQRYQPPPTIIVVRTRAKFPYLDMSSMNEEARLNLQGRLLRDCDDIIFKFCDLIFHAIQSLTTKRVSVVRLRTVLSSLGAYTSVHNPASLLQNEMERLRRAQNIEQIFDILSDYYSFFNYGLIEKIIRLFGTQDDIQRLDAYIRHFRQFCTRRTFWCPPNIFGRTVENGRSVLVVKVEQMWDPHEGGNLDQVLRLRNTLADILEVKPETLYLRRIDRGCVELLFQVPAFVEQDVFPLSPKQESRITSAGITKLTCGCNAFQVEIKTPTRPSVPNTPQIKMERDTGSKKRPGPGEFMMSQNPPKCLKIQGSIQSSASITERNQPSQVPKSIAPSPGGQEPSSQQPGKTSEDSMLREQVQLLRAEYEKLQNRLSQNIAETHDQETFTTAYLRGVNVIGETSFLVTNEAQTLHWEGHGLKLHIPSASLPPDVIHTSINIKASLAGQFQFPANTTLVSAVYWIQTPVVFLQPVTLEIQHCAKSTIDSPLNFAVAKCSQEDLPYRFKPLQGGAFSSNTSYGSISLLHFSGLGITQEGSEEQLYCAKQYYVHSRINWNAHFVVIKDLEVYITAVNKAYLSDKKGPDQRIEFAEDKITLEIAEDGLVTQDGWSIRAVTPLTITKREVDCYECGRHIPSCQLQVKQINEQQQAELYHRVNLQGAKEPYNFIVIIIESDSLPSSSGAGSTDTQTTPQLTDLTAALCSRVADRWDLLGIYLRIPKATLDAIRVARHDQPDNCLVEMLDRWLMTTNPPPTWAAIADAVELLGNGALAEELRSQHCSP